MASTSISDIQRLRAQRFAALSPFRDFEVPSFSLGIDIRPRIDIRPLPSFDECVEGDLGGAAGEKIAEPPETRPGQISNDDRGSLPSGNDGGFESRPVLIVSDEEDFPPCRSAERSRSKPVQIDGDEGGCCPRGNDERFESGTLNIDSEGPLPSGSAEGRPLKRLKRGPSSASKTAVNGASSLLRKGGFERSSHCEYTVNLKKRPLPSFDDVGNQVAENVRINSSGFKSDTLGTGDDGLARGSNLERLLNRLKREPSSVREGLADCSSGLLVNRNVSKDTEASGSGSGINLSKQPFSSVADLRNRFPENNRGSFRGDEDDIEDLSEDELFISGPRSQSNRKSSQSQRLGTIPITVSPSPLTLKKPILHIPGFNFGPGSVKFPAKSLHPRSEDSPIGGIDPFGPGDLGSGSDSWRPTRPDVGTPVQTSNKVDITTPRTGSVSQSSQLDAKDGNFKIFRKPFQTPLRSNTTAPRMDSVSKSSQLDAEQNSDFKGFRKPFQTPFQFSATTPKANSASKSSQVGLTKDLFKIFQRPVPISHQSNIDTPRADPVLKSPQLDSTTESNLRSFDTQTPLRRDTIGTSQTFRNSDFSHSDGDEIAVFLRQRLPHYKPIDALLVDGDLNNEPIYIDYRRQFADGKGIKGPQSEFSEKPGSVYSLQRIPRAKKKSAPKGRKKKYTKGSSSAGGSGKAGKKRQEGSVEGKWRTVNGSRIYIVNGKKLTGKKAFTTYKGNQNSSKKKTKRRPTGK